MRDIIYASEKNVAGKEACREPRIDLREVQYSTLYPYLTRGCISGGRQAEA